MLAKNHGQIRDGQPVLQLKKTKLLAIILS